MIPVTKHIGIDERDLSETFVHASGPGGQNVNKVATAVQLRFDLRAASMPEPVKARLVVLAGRRMTKDGVMVIIAQRFSSQERNRQDARDRLVELVQRAAVAPVPRRATRPTLGSKVRRLEAKSRRGQHKAMRGPVRDD